MHGYAEKFLEVDLTNDKIREVKFNDEVLRDYIGGRGLAAKILWDNLGERWDAIDPLGPENLLLILTGPLTGFYPGSRVCVAGKSPQSNGMIGSTTSGEFAVELKCAGYDGVILKGKAECPSYLSIVNSHVEIKKATHIWGQDGKQTLRILVKEEKGNIQSMFPGHGLLKEPAVLYIGPAGEKLARIAAVMGKWTHAAGYGGYGAVMGSKNLKAITVKGTGPLPPVDNIEEVKALIEKVCKTCYLDEDFRRWGTGSGGYYVGAKTSSEPVRNWQEEWHDEKSFAGDRFDQRVWVKKYWGDFGCPTTCLKIAVTKSGAFKNAVTDNPDYELQAYLGTNLGIFTPEENVYLSALADDLGICGIQGGNVLGFAAEIFQRGIITRKELDGLELNWGNAKAFGELLKKIANREGIGNILAEGTFRAAMKLKQLKKQEVLKYAIQEKGVAIGAHGIRSGKDYTVEISYACSVQAGDHTSVANSAAVYGPGELGTIFYDSAVYCFFNSFGVPKNVRWKFYRAVTGWRLTPREWYKVKALRILHIQRALLLLGGPDFKWDPEVHDDNPPRFYEPLPSGPYKGKTVSKENFEKLKKAYYEGVGWDEKGIPKSSVLKKLGLEKVNDVLKKKIGEV
jgi:aldehyde:ferredoxin oxidoreductase